MKQRWEAYQKSAPSRRVMIDGVHDLEIQALFELHGQCRKNPEVAWILQVDPMDRAVAAVEPPEAVKPVTMPKASPPLESPSLRSIVPTVAISHPVKPAARQTRLFGGK